MGTGRGRDNSLFFGGTAFLPQACEGVWSGVPSSFFFSPFYLEEREISAENIIFSLPKAIGRQDIPNREEWEGLVLSVLKRIQMRELKKVVLARQTTLFFQNWLDPVELFKTLSSLEKESFLYLLEFHEGIGVVGASPEQLFERRGDILITEALAGTKQFGEKWTQKEHLELTYVKLFLEEKLQHCCQTIHWGPLKEKSFGPLQHLYQQVEGKLKEAKEDRKLLHLLSPTPALGGYPQQEALEHLRQAESFPRGWYGGSLGRFSSDESQVAVVIRSALFRERELHLFTGAGIVEGSDPSREWEELDRKLIPFKKLL